MSTLPWSASWGSPLTGESIEVLVYSGDELHNEQVCHPDLFSLQEARHAVQQTADGTDLNCYCATGRALSCAGAGHAGERDGGVRDPGGLLG